MMSFAELVKAYQDLQPEEMLRAFVDTFPKEVAVGSSFGARSPLVLGLVHKVNPNLPVLSADTGKIFEETGEYRTTLIEFFGLTNVQVLTPDQAMLKAHDPDGSLWENNNDACCELRKGHPFRIAIRPYKVIVTGRMRIDGGMREKMSPIEKITYDGIPYIRVNPIARMTKDEAAAQFKAYHLPRHPLVKRLPSIGCVPCTHANSDPNDSRRGRSELNDKRECGLHPPPKLAE